MGIMHAFILGCISCSGQPEAGRRPLCDQELASMDRRSRQRGDDAEESLTLANDVSLTRNGHVLRLRDPKLRTPRGPSRSLGR